MKLFNIFLDSLSSFRESRDIHGNGMAGAAAMRRAAQISGMNDSANRRVKPLHC